MQFLISIFLQTSILIIYLSQVFVFYIIVNPWISTSSTLLRLMTGESKPMIVVSIGSYFEYKDSPIPTVLLFQALIPAVAPLRIIVLLISKTSFKIIRPG